MRASDLDYELPEALIAQHPPADRREARLLQLPPGGGPLRHGRIDDLPGLMPPSLVVLNDTRVLPARLFGQRPTGGRVELLLLEPLGAPAAGSDDASPLGDTWLALARPAKKLQPGVPIRIADGFDVIPLGRSEHGELRVQLRAEAGIEAALQAHGRMPLPPYIRREAGAGDLERYQTVFARHPGAVAAPTAGLHFTPALLDALRAAGHRLAYVTLHVGPGTFAPLRGEVLSEHPMHAERFDVPSATAAAIADARVEGRPVLAIGTTVVRTLEAAADGQGGVRAGPGRTDIFIYPPYRFQVVDALLTNFHLPRSTLLALVMAFAGEQRVRAAYAAAIAQGYRFFSYGDAMLLGGGDQ